MTLSLTDLQLVGADGPGFGVVREPRRPRPATGPQIGHDPALNLGGPAASGARARHAVSLRWLGASILSGLTGALLLGAAVYVSSEGEITFAELPERAASAPPRPGDQSSADKARKGDKLIRAETIASARQAFRAPMTLRVGDREVIKVRNFVRISTNLSLTSAAYAADIPAFDPVRLMNDSAPERLAEPMPETSDAEVSVKKGDLALALLDSSGPALSDEDVAAQVRAELQARAAGERPGTPAAASLPVGPLAFAPKGQTRLGPALDPSASDPSFRSIEVRVVPENVTSVPKTAARGESTYIERTVAIRRGDTPESVLRANGATAAAAAAMATALGIRDRAPASLEGLQMRLLLQPARQAGEGRPVVRAVLYGDRGIEAIGAMTDRGAFVSVTPPRSDQAAQQNGAEDDDDQDADGGSGTTLYQSLYETALKQELPKSTIDDLVRIFSYDVDFQHRVTAGDAFQIFFATDEEGADRPEILSASLTVGSELHRVYRDQAEDGSVDYYDELGRSLKKFLVRKPVPEARMSSSFGVRYHPILGYSKMHTGVDWAAPYGTPIMATGSGTVVMAGMSSGYGRRVEIQHANGYMTTYNHMSGFGRGVAPGVKVRQGQVIGFIGTTGLSTGPHTHYEVIVNGHFVDPMKIRVPRSRELEGRALADFERQRDQIDQLLQKAGSPSRLAERDTR